MKLSLQVQDNQKGTTYDATGLLVKATWSGQMAGQPGKLELELLRDGMLTFFEGSPVRLTVDGVKLFSGWVFSKHRSHKGQTRVVCYDQTRYLKNCDSYVFEEATASDIFTRVCADFQLKSKVVHPSAYILPSKPYSNKTLGHIIQDSIDLTKEDTGREYLIRDNFGVLEFLDSSQLNTELILGPGSLLEKYDYTTSIDDDTYNRIKLVREDNQEAQREEYVVDDSATIALWGILQHCEKVEEALNAAQLKEKGDSLLEQKNRVSRTLSLDALGDLRVLPGNSVWVEAKLDDMSLSRHMLVRSCSHRFKNQKHTMRVELEVAEE